MARYRKIDVRVWVDAKFRGFTRAEPNGQTLWLYLLTCPESTNVPGLIPAYPGAMAGRLGWTVEAFLEAFAEAFGEGFGEGLAEADWEAGLVWIPNAIRFNEPESPNVVRSWRQTIDELPECPLRDRAIAALRKHFSAREPYAKAFAEACGKPSAKPSVKPSPKALANQEQEQEQDSEEALSRAPAREAQPPAPAPAPAPTPSPSQGARYTAEDYAADFERLTGRSSQCSPTDQAAALRLLAAAAQRLQVQAPQLAERVIRAHQAERARASASGRSHGAVSFRMLADVEHFNALLDRLDGKAPSEAPPPQARGQPREQPSGRVVPDAAETEARLRTEREHAAKVERERQARKASGGPERAGALLSDLRARSGGPPEGSP